MRRPWRGRSRAHSAATRRLFTKYAAITLVPVLALGLALALTLSSQVRQHGIDEGIAEAHLIAQIGVEPELAAHPLSHRLGALERKAVRHRIAAAVQSNGLLGFGVYALSGKDLLAVGATRQLDVTALDAATAGGSAGQLTQLPVPGGGTVTTVEVYQPLYVGPTQQLVGVLRIELPYAPISANVASGLTRLYIGLAGGLTLLYLALLAITLSVSRVLRRQLAVNATQAELLRARAQEHRMMFEDNPLPMIAYDRETLQIVAVSNTAVATYGWTREEFLTMSLVDIRPPDEVANLLRRLEAEGGAQRIGFHGGYQTRHRYKNGVIVDVEVSSDDVTVSGRACRLILCQDVTARNKATADLAVARDAAIEASNTKSAFLANVSHEIRTPMNGVLGMTELLLATDLDQTQRDYAQQVARSGEHMLAIINDILDISKIETGRLELDVTDFALHETIEHACAGGQIGARSKGIGFVVSIDSAVPRLARGDGGRVRQILMNLVTNAVKFTSNGAVRVTVTAPECDAERMRLRFEVADDGIGINPDRLEQMFEPFTQADVSTTRKYGGTGLGLAIARELVELMGGQIGAESELGVGSTFWFEIELATASERIAEPLEEEAVDATVSQPIELDESTPIVLVVDDTPVNQIVAVRALQRCGCRAEVVSDGYEALTALLEHRFDAVLMDCQMPEMDGYEATHELRQREVGGRRTPVIAMTAAAMKGDFERCIASGMDDYVSKPLRHRVLEETLQRWIPRLAAAASKDAA